MAGKRPALLIVDVQKDFCPGGALAVERGDEVVPVLNAYVERFNRPGRLIYTSRDWHPEKTTHFQAYGGQWPSHCVAGSEGAQFHPDLHLPDSTIIVSKGQGEDEDAYSAFQARNDKGVGLGDSLRAHEVGKLYIGGLATDYCVRASVLDALAQGFQVDLLEDAVRGVNLRPGDADRAIEEMTRAGARRVSLRTLDLDTNPPF